MAREPRDEVRRAIYGDETAAIQPGVRPPMLDIRPSRGPWLALPYQSLRLVEFEPDGKPPLRIEFSSHIIEVEGRQLEALYLATVGHRASIITEVQELYLDEEEAEAKPVVERIRVERKRRSTRGDRDAEA